MRIQTLFAAILVATVLAACEAATGPLPAADVQYPAANLHQDTYDPGPGWTLAWSDEFDGDVLDEENWNRQVEKAGRFNGEWQRYTDSSANAYVNDGCLVIRAIHESDRHGMGQYTSARLNTANKQAWTYGKIAARIQLPHGKGVWPAFWMLGANIDENGGDTPWPQSGEIDILELYGSRDDGVVEANIHYAGATGRHANMGAVAYELDEGRFADNFHVFELEWTAESLTWFVDGRPFASASIAAGEFSEFHRDFFILLNIAVGGRAAGSPDSTTDFPLQMYVDWVRVYQESR
jgi:beta-glucanase (GH16 family)